MLDPDWQRGLAFSSIMIIKFCQQYARVRASWGVTQYLRTPNLL